MKFFEFSTKKFDYYALIRAETIFIALKLYQESVSDIEGTEIILPEEVTEEQAKEKYLEVASKEFEEESKSTRPEVILIDKELI